LLQLYPFTKTEQTYQESSVYTAEINGKQASFLKLKEEAVNAQYLQEDFPNAQLIVFLSRHSSQSGTPTLSVHTPGNFGEAGLGGLPKTVSISPAMAMHDALKALEHYREKLTLDYAVSFECTHHGPSLNVPTMFVELGSSEPQWRDSNGAQAVAHAAMAAIANFSIPADPAVLGIGGPHYSEKFTRMALAEGALFGHMIPKYAVSAIDSEMIEQCVRKTSEKVSRAILDWKGVKSEDKLGLLAALETAGLPFRKV
jgi:D-aminoacyl-tRNA deacylase